jgi:hypothetical protein
MQQNLIDIGYGGYWPRGLDVFQDFFIRQCKPMMHQYDTCLFTIFLILRKWGA